MTEQEVFDKVWEALKARGWTRAGVTRPDGKFQCQYRSPVGPCAIGLFIPDELYDPKMDEENWQTRFAVKLAPNLLVSEFKGPSFLEDLQDAHDLGATPEEMETYFRKVASEYNLEIPA